MLISWSPAQCTSSSTTTVGPVRVIADRNEGHAGLTFGSISALFGLTNGYIDQAQYAVLVTTVILSAVVPNLIATTFFEPRVREAIEAEEIEAAEEIDAGPIPHPAVSIERE